MNRSDAGRFVLSGVAALTAAGGWLADVNRTHLFNPRWLPHAKFHDAWTVLLGTGLGSLGLYLLRRRGTDPELDLALGAGLPALFWTAQAGSYLFPGTKGMESEFPDRLPEVAGVRVNEAVGSALMLTLTAAGYLLARRGAEDPESGDRGPRRILLEDSKRKTVGEGTPRRPSLRSLPERSFSRR